MKLPELPKTLPAGGMLGGLLKSLGVDPQQILDVAEAMKRGVEDMNAQLGAIKAQLDAMQAEDAALRNALAVAVPEFGELVGEPAFKLAAQVHEAQTAPGAPADRLS